MNTEEEKLTVEYENGRFICLCSYKSRIIPKNAGFCWDPSKKVWFTNSVRVAYKLKSYFDENAWKQMNKAFNSCKGESYSYNSRLKSSYRYNM